MTKLKFDGKKTTFEVIKSLRWMKDIDFFMQPVRIRLTRKTLFDR